MMDGKRKPMLAKKPAVVVAIGAGKPEADGLMCPKCGHELADTPDNRAYAEGRMAEMEEDGMDEAEA